MNKYIKITATSVAAVGLILILIPQERIDALRTSWARLTGDPVQICLDYEKSSLKDPDSAVLLGAKVNGPIVYIDYKAKNSYGAYIKSKTVCGVLDGKIHEEHTQGLREIEEMKRDLAKREARAACLNRRNEKTLQLMQKGASHAEAWSQTECPAVE